MPTQRQKKPYCLGKLEHVTHLEYSLLKADADMLGPQTHTQVSTWHFWHICKGLTDNQRV